MDRLNDILSNSRLPARLPAADKRIHSDYRLSTQRLPLIRRTPQEQQGRKQNQSPTMGQDAAAQEAPYQQPTPQQRPYPYQQHQRPAYNQPEDTSGPRREPITRTDYPTYPIQSVHPQGMMDTDSIYHTPQSRTQPHQDQPHLQPLQPRPSNDYYAPHRGSDDYTSALHADVVDDDGWEGGMVYADFEQGNTDTMFFEDEEVEELAEEQIGYQPPRQHNQYSLPQPSMQDSQPPLPPQRRQIPPSFTPPQAQNDQPLNLQGRIRRQQTEQLRDQQSTQNTPGQANQNSSTTQRPANPPLPRLSNLHDTRLASALARQRASRQNPPYQRVTQPLNTNIMPKQNPAAAAQPPVERTLPPRPTRAAQTPPAQPVQPTTEPIAPIEPEEEVIHSRQVPQTPAHTFHPLRTTHDHDQPRTATLPEVSDSPLPAPKKVCPRCKGAGYLRANVPFGHPNFGKPIACECKEAERKERRRQQLRALSNLDDFRDRNFAEFQLNAAIIEAFDAARTFAEDPYGWLVLVGPNGCGKTHLAAAIANQRLEQGSVVLFEAVPDLLDHLRAAFAPSAEDVYDQLFSKMREAELLVLDDLGAQQSTPWANEKLFQLLNYRYNREMPTVITANQKGIQAIDERIRSRLGDTSLVAYITMDKARDYRPIRGKVQQ
jgi:DNA replication protein